MTNWQTTISGIVVLIGGSLPLVDPHLANWSAFLVAIGSGLIGIFAQDARNKNNQPQNKP